MLVHLERLTGPSGQDRATRLMMILAESREPEHLLSIGDGHGCRLALLERQPAHLLCGLVIQATSQVCKGAVGDHHDLMRLQRAHVVRAADEPHGHSSDCDDAEYDGRADRHTLRHSISKPGCNNRRKHDGHSK